MRYLDLAARNRPMNLVSNLPLRKPSSAKTDSCAEMEASISGTKNRLVINRTMYSEATLDGLLDP